MLQLLAISYKNIWPFEGQTKTVIIEKWKFLIKAPIGSGKSFLFFDGPVYALYKHSTRNMVNNNSTGWVISVVFSIDEVSYLLIRKLKKGKSKDTCQSQLFLLNNSYNFSDYDIITDDISVVTILEQQSAIWEELLFKNETDLQSNISDLLPPREVFLSTMFLLQDAPNIFELTPAERVVIFKNVFWLLGIDEAKDIIWERKREIQTIRKVKSDDERFNSKLRTNLHAIIENYKKLENYPVCNDLLTINYEIIDEWQRFKENVNISHFGLDWFDKEMIVSLMDRLSVLVSDFQVLKNQFIEQNSRLEKEKAEYEIFSKKKSHLISLIADLEAQLKLVDLSHLTNLKTQKQLIRQQQLVLEASLPHAIHESFIQKDSSLQAYIWTWSPTSLSGWKSLVEKVVDQWKYLSEQNKSFDHRLQDIARQKKMYLDQIKELELKPWTKAYTNMISLKNQKVIFFQEKLKTYENQIVQIKEKTKNHNEDIDQIDKKINNYLTSIKSESVFQCKKISSDCPYIKMINSKSIKELQLQLDTLKAEKEQKVLKFEELWLLSKTDELESFIKSLTKEIELLEANPVAHLDEYVNQLEKEKDLLWTKLREEKFEETIGSVWNDIEKNSHLVTLFKQFLQESQRKVIDENHSKHEDCEKKVRVLESEINVLETAQAKIEAIQQKLAVTTKELSLNDEMIAKQEVLLKELDEKVEWVRVSLMESKYKDLNTAQHQLKLLDQSYSSLDELIQEYKQGKQEIEMLLAQEKRLTNLYNIFSKELLYLVLENSIPLLNDIINSYLSQIVDYSLQLNIVEENQKISMEAKIVDEKWERDVSALSWGQKTILKLVWMLSVASFMHSPLLFLDETINNLDNEAVWLVADMLEDFVRKHDISFYTVTHSQQIQEMSIWDGVVVL